MASSAATVGRAVVERAACAAAISASCCSVRRMGDSTSTGRGECLYYPCWFAGYGDKRCME